jgi:hypothetical protein
VSLGAAIPVAHRRFWLAQRRDVRPNIWASRRSESGLPTHPPAPLSGSPLPEWRQHTAASVRAALVGHARNLAETIQSIAADAIPAEHAEAIRHETAPEDPSTYGPSPQHRHRAAAGPTRQAAGAGAAADLAMAEKAQVTAALVTCPRPGSPGVGSRAIGNRVLRPPAAGLTFFSASTSERHRGLVQNRRYPFPFLLSGGHRTWSAAGYLGRRHQNGCRQRSCWAREYQPDPQELVPYHETPLWITLRS